MRLRLLVEIRAAALADIHTRERQETRWRQNIHTGAAVCPAFIRKHWEVCCMKIMDKAAFEEQNVFGLGAPNDAFARYFAGRSYLNPLTRPEDGLFLANVTFEPGCRNNWHIHHASEGRRAAADLHRRRGLVPGGGQRGGQPGARQSHRHPGGGQALARRQAGQLVQPHRRRDAR